MPTTWSEFMDVCQKIKDAGYDPITVDDAYYPCLYGTYLAMMKGPDWVTELLSDTTGANWSDPAVAQMADDFAAMRANGYFSDSCGSNVFPSAQNGEFAMGTAAMYYNGSWLPNEVHDITGDDFQWGAMFFPAPDNAEYPYTTYSTGCQFFGITKGCEHPEEALALLESSPLSRHSRIWSTRRSQCLLLTASSCLRTSRAPRAAGAVHRRHSLVRHVQQQLRRERRCQRYVRRAAGGLC